MILRRELRPEVRPPSIRFRAPNIHMPMRWLILGWTVVLAWRSLRWLATHRRWAVVLIVASWVLVTNRVLSALVLLCATAGTLCLWWALQPGSFTRWVLRPVQLELREWLTYRRNWQPAMLTAGLSLRENWGGDLPVLRKVGSDAGRDALLVRMLPGQTLERWQAAAPALAQTFGVRAVRVRRIPERPQELWLTLQRGGAQTSRIRHVTEAAAEQEPDQAPTGRGAFPRQPHGGAA